MYNIMIIYIYIYREREIYRCVHMRTHVCVYIYIYIHMCLYIYIYIHTSPPQVASRVERLSYVATIQSIGVFVCAYTILGNVGTIGIQR